MNCNKKMDRIDENMEDKMENKMKDRIIKIRNNKIERNNKVAKNIAYFFVAVFMVVMCGINTMESFAYGTPRLIVTGYDIAGGEVKAGEKFDLTLHLRNTQSRTAINNIKLSLSAADSEFMTASGSDSIYIEKIPAEEDYDVTVEMVAKQDLESKPYVLTISMDYEDRYDQGFQETEKITIPVTRETKIKTTDISIGRKEITVGEKTSISFAINNIGKEDVCNVSVVAEGKGIKSSENYIGNIKPGNSGYANCQIEGVEAISEDNNIKVTVIYEDNNGKEKQQEQEFTIGINEPKAIEAVSTVEKKSNNSFIFVGAIAVVIVLMIAIKVSKKRKEEAEDNEID